jgi:Glycosyl transferases group 1
MARRMPIFLKCKHRVIGELSAERSKSLSATGTYLETQIKLLQSPSLSQRVVTKLLAQGRPKITEFAGFPLPPPPKASEFETFGCVLIEAMFCGCPVLTTKVGGIPTVVREGEGLFVDVGNIRAMVDCMIAMLDGKHQLDMEKVSRETRRRFSYSTVGLLLHQAHLAATSKQHS